MKKELLAAAVSLSMTLGITSAYAEFTDVDSNAWYADSVNYMIQNGYMNGVSDTEFEPNTSMTRAMFVTVLGRMDGADASAYNKKIFPDVDMGEWYAPYVNWALENGIVTGFDDLNFHPSDEINRAQLSVMLKRYIESKGYQIADNPGAYDSYIDENSIPQWSKDGADFVRRTGIINGDAYGAFMPLTTATRAQIAATVMRIRTLMNGETLDIPQRLTRTAAEVTIDNMSLNDKIYQMIAVTPEQLTGVTTATLAGEATSDAIKKKPYGMLIYSEKNILNADQIKTMVETTASYTSVKPFMAIAEETGSGAQLSSKLGGDVFKDAYDYRMADTSEIKNAYSTLSTQLRYCGFNVNLAPTADIWSNPSNTYIGKKAFGNTYQECSPQVKAAIEGIDEASVLSAMKYFPGYGSSSQNPLTEKCTSTKTADDLRNEDFNTYKDGIDAGADIVMCANVYMINIDEKYPAPMSQTIVTDLLKNELGFTGVVMTDDLRMKSISQQFSTSDIAVQSIKAGCDLLLCPQDPEEAASAIMKALSSGEITEDRINESVRKILDAKTKAGIL